MAFSSKLAELFVSFVAKGQNNIQAAMAGVANHLQQVQAVGNAAGQAIQNSFAPITKIGQQISNIFGNTLGPIFSKVFNIAKSIIGLLTGGATLGFGGLIAAGIAFSGMGTLLAYRLERLSLVMAGLFRPEIQKVIEYLTRFTTWLSSSGNFIRKFLDALAPIERVFFRIVDAMGPLFHAFDRLLGAIGDIANDITSILAFAFENTLIPQLEVIVDWLTMMVDQLTEAIKLIEIMTGLDLARRLVGEDAPSRAPFAPKAGGAEQIGAAYNRIAQLSLMATGGSIEKQQLDTLKQIEKNTGRTGQTGRPDAPTYTEGDSFFGKIGVGVGMLGRMVPLPTGPK